MNHPPHYAETRIECIDALEAMVEHWPGVPAGLAMNIVKYVWRHRQKEPVQSLKKARWYLDRLIKHVEAEAATDELRAIYAQMPELPAVVREAMR